MNVSRLARLSLILCLSPALSAAQSSASARKTVPTKSEPANLVLRDFDSSVQEVAQRASPAVVQIFVSGLGSSRRRAEGVLEHQRGIGSGVVVSSDGYIMTNGHVVAGAQRIRVVLSRVGTELIPQQTSFLQRPKTYEAKLVGSNSFTDLALLKIEEKNLAYLPLKEEFSVRLGQTVLAIGSPEGLEHTVTMGIVSAPGRQTEPDRPMIYVQTDAPINPGNSGGALVDRDGNLVGINTFIYSKSGGSEGLGFAIAQPTVRFVYQELKENGHVRRNLIGANAQTITPILQSGLKLTRDWGVVISDVLPGGPADKAGLQPRDIVLTIDNVVIDSLPRFTARLYVHPHNQPITMSVQRDSGPVTLTIQPVDAPTGVDSLTDLIGPQESLISPLGIFVVDLNKALENNYPKVRSSSGVIVVGRVDYAPPIETDLNAGDVIQAFNGVDVDNAARLRSELLKLRTGDPVVLRVERDGAYQFVPFELE